MNTELWPEITFPCLPWLPGSSGTRFSFFQWGPVANEGFPGGSVVKNPPANAGDAGSVPGSGSSPGGGNGHPLQHSCLENPMDRGAPWATVTGVAGLGHELATKQKVAAGAHH